MFLKRKRDGGMIKVADTEPLFNPMTPEIEGNLQGGQAAQPVEKFDKSELRFPSGEALPQCWIDANYQDD
ncbi:MAG: acetyltransferase [Cyanobacteria bacterium P01_A01_bin.105]